MFSNRKFCSLISENNIADYYKKINCYLWEVIKRRTSCLLFICALSAKTELSPSIHLHNVALVELDGLHGFQY